MNIHEHQGKQIFKKYGVRVPEGRMIEEGADVEGRAEKAATELQKERNNKVWVVKAQIHAGGRGKAMSRPRSETASGARRIISVDAGALRGGSHQRALEKKCSPRAQRGNAKIDG